jgi:hypothetical protein
MITNFDAYTTDPLNNFSTQDIISFNSTLIGEHTPKAFIFQYACNGNAEHSSYY